MRSRTGFNLARIGIRLSAVLLAVAMLAGCSRRSSVTIQVDFSKAIATANRICSAPDGPHSFSHIYGFAAGFDSTLLGIIESDEFKALPIAASILKDDDINHDRSLKALSAMCSCTVRDEPQAARITVTCSNEKDATELANCIGTSVRNGWRGSLRSLLTERREAEVTTTMYLRGIANDLETRLNQERGSASAQDSDAASPQIVPIRAIDSSNVITRVDMMTRELARRRAEVDARLATTAAFEDIEKSMKDWYPFWIVSEAAMKEPGWIAVPKASRWDMTITFGDSLAGPDWLSATLSTSNETLARVVGEPGVASTMWARSFAPPQGSSPGAPASIDTAAAVSDLSRRITITQHGGPSSLSIGLSGSMSAEDRRAVLTALARHLTDARRNEVGAILLARQESLDKASADLSIRASDLWWSFEQLAKRSEATTATIAALYETSVEGKEHRRLADEYDAKQRQRRDLDLCFRPLFSDVKVGYPDRRRE